MGYDEETKREFLLLRNFLTEGLPGRIIQIRLQLDQLERLEENTWSLSNFQGLLLVEIFSKYVSLVRIFDRNVMVSA